MATGKDEDLQLDQVVSTREMAEALRASGAVDDLLAQIDTGEVALTGEGGLLPGLIKLALERGLAAELTDHLGYEKGEPAGRGLPNARNGSSAKTVQTEAGPVPLDVPRDREGSFTPRLVPKGQRRIGGLDDMIVSLYAGGMTLRDIQFHLQSTIGTEVSHETISKIVDEISEAVLSWQHRPLDALYPVIYLDAIVVKVKDGGHTRNKAAHIAVGVDMAGIKHVLGIWVQQNEGASFWASVCADLANRGVRDVLIVCCDGLTGFPEAIAATWSQAAIQTCVVHLIRNALRFVSYSDRKTVAAALKPIYTAPNAEAARAELDAFTASEMGKKNPTVTRVFDRAWEQFTPFLAFPPELRRAPHSGDDTAWQSLIGLLDDRLGDLPADLSGRDREDDRKLLAKYMIQRQRADIREYLTGDLREDTPFPERETTETAYKLTAGYRQLFDDVMDYVREQVTDPKLSAVRQRVRWWSAIALLRCLASSPAAAEQTLLNRSAVAAADDQTEVDAYAEPRVLDTDLDDTLEAEDVTVGADTGDNDETDTKARKRLRELATQAAALKGPRSDAKLKRLIPLLKALLDQGYHPIVFCRYIPTADYLAEHLGSALAKVKDLKIDAVTGTLPPEEREARVETLSAHDGPRLLIATDCLSEGINLQDGFTAVVHYDLAWNPTRHEQREGRVDRFGQQAPTVRTVTYYGEDNGIDGLVLEVLIRRHENIKRSIGVAVPIPIDSTTVMKAIWESLLLRGKEAEQLTLDFGAATSQSLADQVEVEWTNAAEREKVSRSRFRQAGLKPDTIEAALTEVRRALGGPADVETFTRTALSLLGAPVSDTGDGFTAVIDTLPAAVRDQLPPAKGSRLHFHRSLPVPAGHSVLTRTDATVDALSRYVLDAALDARLDPAARPARRGGVMRTREVDKVTTLLMVRNRLEITIPGSATTVTQVAEEAKFLAFTATGESLTWLPQADVDTLLTLKPSGNVDDSLARMQLGRALGRLDALTEHLTATGKDAAKALVSEHQAVRSASKAAGRAPTVRFLPPADVLGVYVFLPEAGTR